MDRCTDIRKQEESPRSRVDARERIEPALYGHVNSVRVQQRACNGAVRRRNKGRAETVKRTLSIPGGSPNNGSFIRGINPTDLPLLRSGRNTREINLINKQ